MKASQLPAEPPDLLTWAEGVIPALVTYFANHSVDLPARRRIVPGQLSLDAWDCVAAGTMVTTLRGPLPIEQVRCGDRVWSHQDGHMVAADVTATMDKGERSVLRISTGRRAVRVTPEHNMLRLDCSRTCNGARNEWRAEWVRADQLRPGDYLVAAERVPDTGMDAVLPDGTVLSEDVAWLLGAFTADGTVNSRNLNLCLFGAESDKARRILETVWGLHTSHDSKHGIVAGAAKLCRALTLLGLHLPSTQRLVPPMILDSPDKIKRAYLNGYADGDGHRLASESVAYAAANRPLIDQIRALHLALGDVVDNVHTEPRRRPITIAGTLVKDAKPLHRFRAFPESKRRHTIALEYRGARRALPDRNLTIERVRSVEADGVAHVYDLTVAGTHNFLADGLVAHNCEQVSVGFAGITDPARQGTIAGGPRTGTPFSALKQRQAAYGIQIVHCIPPCDGFMTTDTDEFGIAGRQMLTESALLSQFMVDAASSPPTFHPEGVAVETGDVTPLGPSGGYYAIEASIIFTVMARAAG